MRTLLFLALAAAASAQQLDEALQAAFESHRQQDFATAERLLVEAVREAERVTPPDARLPVALNNLAAAYQFQDRFPEAERTYRRALSSCQGVCNPLLLARFSINLANLYLEDAAVSKAERLGLPALRAPLAAAYPADAENARLSAMLGAIANARGRLAEAAAHYEEALAFWERRGALDADALQALNNLALIYARTGRRAEAMTKSRRAVELAARVIPNGHPLHAMFLASLGSIYFAADGPAAAEPYYRQALDIAEPALGPRHPLVGRILLCYSVALGRTHNGRLARDYRRRAEEILGPSVIDLELHTVDFKALVQRAEKN
jgi:tetratricopeptide (TPR) repeat protein